MREFVFCRLVALMALIGALLAPAPASAGIGQLRVAETGLCVDTSGRGAVFLSRCNSRDPGQRWVFLLNGDLRPAIARDKCLDVSRARFRNGTGVTVYPCNDTRAQNWNRNRGRLRTHGIMCLDVPGGNFRPGVKLIIWRCHGRKNQRISAPERGTVTNNELVAFGFPSFVECWSPAEYDKKPVECFPGFRPPDPNLAPGLNLSRVRPYIASLRWGFHTGGGDDWHTNPNFTLDVGQRYSLDRCSLWHDQIAHNDWPDDHCGGLVAYKRCLDRVEPSNHEEKNAVHIIRKVLNVRHLCVATIPARKDGELPAR